MSKKEEIKAKEKQLLDMVGSFSEEHINEEYRELCGSLVKKMGRKHDVPFKRGKIEIWASAVIYAVGQINFLFDKSFEPHVSPDEICDYFKTKKSTVSDKARKIRDMFNMGYYDEEFSTEDMKDSNPMKDMVFTEDGFIVPKSMLYEDDEEEEYTNIVKILAEKSGQNEEVLKEIMIKDFIEGRGEDFNENELEPLLELLSRPIPKGMEDEFIETMLNDGDNLSSGSSSQFDTDDELFDENNPLETIEDYQRAIELFRTVKGEEYFEENKGHFWLIHETRPFMTYLLEQAMLLLKDGQKENGVNQLKYILELNPGDNQGIRYILISQLLELNRLNEVEDLLNFYDEEYSTTWVFSELLLGIKNKKDKKLIEELYKGAIGANKHVVPLLTGEKKFPSQFPGYYSMGDENEAAIYVDLAFKAWTEDKVAMNILKEFS
ncbi:MAG: type I-E CRISPR-associated protein Cse1/CasA [Methanobrevibacter sp.]|nr:type I-E CRISPR-associated protein Cse1/CasA [Methanobrevibacter sp.]